MNVSAPVSAEDHALRIELIFFDVDSIIEERNPFTASTGNGKGES